VVFLLCLALFLFCTSSATSGPTYCIDNTGQKVEFNPPEQDDPVPGWRCVSPHEPEHQIAPSGTVFQVAYPRWHRFSDDRVCVQLDGKFGYADYAGHVAIPATFTEAHDFSEGHAIVSRAPEQAYEVIDKNGRTVSKLPSGVIPMGSIQNGIWSGTRGNDLLEMCTDRPPDYQPTSLYCISKNTLISFPACFSLDPFSEGRVGIRFAQKGCGFLDQQGQIVVAPDYQDVRGFHEGLAAVCKAHRYFYIDENGKEVITLPADCSYACDFSEGLAAIAVGGIAPEFKEDGVIRRGSRWAFIDTSGKVVIPPKFFPGERFPVPTRFCEGLAAVMEAPAHNFGFIDRTGKWAIAPKFRSVDRLGPGEYNVTERDTDFATLWKEGGIPHGRLGAISRGEALRIFLEQYIIFDLSRSRICELLGKPDKATLEADSYCISSSCGDSSFVEFQYSSDHVHRYRLSYLPPDEWFDREHPDHGDW